MKEFIATVTSKGQVTVPAEVRRRLGLKSHDRLAFVIDEEGVVCLRTPRYAGIAALRGAAGSLEKPLTWRETRAIAREDHLKIGDQKKNE